MSKPSPTPSAPLTGVRTYRGGCHCGAVRLEADMDLSAGTNRCNCTFCTKVVEWNCVVKPAAFRLLSGADHLQHYPPKSTASSYPFCKVCGIHAFGRGNIPELGGEVYAVNLHCLDEADRLSGLPVRYLDGRNDTWERLATGVSSNPFRPAAPGA